MTVGQYKEITELVYDDLTPIAYNIELISIFEDCDPAEVRALPAREVQTKSEMIKSEMENVKVCERFKLDNKNLYLKDFKVITLGEFIDLEHYIIKGDVHKVLAVLYRKRTGGNFYNYVYEDYAGVNIDFRSELFLDVNGTTILGAVKEYVKFRNNIIKTYSSLFSEEDDTMTEDDVMTESERKMMEAQKLHGQFAWESLILFLCGDDITKWNEVTDLPLMLAFNIVSYRKAAIR